MPAIPAPLQVLAADVTLDDELNEAPREQAVQLARVERQVVRRWILRLVRVVEYCLFVGFTPSMCPFVLHSIHFHSEAKQKIVESGCLQQHNHH